MTYDIKNEHESKEPNKRTHLLLGVAKYKEYRNHHINSMCQRSIKTTRLLLGVAKYKESYNTTKKRVCREIIKTTLLLLGVAKCKEYKIQQIKGM